MPCISYAARDRRCDVAVSEIEFGGIDLALIGQHIALILVDQRLLRGERLLGNRILSHQFLITFEIKFGIGKQSHEVRRYRRN